ncbi:uncharacterized protein BKA78DRAFT_300824 [Phyllosticta capitalensis]|uniref:uncharacterized protein n=1 Tax=Phyllosticta capitalensis TaxID=121624 RepID=UPI00312FA3F0
MSIWHAHGRLCSKKQPHHYHRNFPHNSSTQSHHLRFTMESPKDKAPSMPSLEPGDYLRPRDYIDYVYRARHGGRDPSSKTTQTPDIIFTVFDDPVFVNKQDVPKEKK